MGPQADRSDGAGNYVVVLAFLKRLFDLHARGHQVNRKSLRFRRGIISPSSNGSIINKINHLTYEAKEEATVEKSRLQGLKEELQYATHRLLEDTIADVDSRCWADRLLGPIRLLRHRWYRKCSDAFELCLMSKFESGCG